MTALMKLKGIGRRGAVRLLNSAPEDIDRASFRDFVVAHVTKDVPTRDEILKAWDRSEGQIQLGHENGVAAFSIADEAYPDRLRTIPDPPAVLFVKGDARALRRPHALAIVGTREPTEFGATVARRSGKTATQSDFVIVSGLALGCDTHGHEGCLDASGVGVAVLAHGLDRVYPAANRKLAERLLDARGCLVAEYPFGTAPIRSAFAERDRIQSGLSDGVLVIETDVKGGTMHTVRFSRDQQRMLACVDHPPRWRSEDKTQGNQKLIADNWAVPIADGAALSNFLCVLKDRQAPSAPAVKVPAQASMAF